MSNSTTVMNISRFVSTVTKLPAETSVLIRGDHGIGKSQLVQQIAKIIASKDPSLKDFPVIDRRLSQMSDGDMIGLPSTDGEVTRFNPPDWYKTACKMPCVVFLDELNRATPEVMQAAFQIVLDHELNGIKLHPKTRVFAAINMSSVYTVNEVDPALLDRFWAIDLVPTCAEWLDFARSKNENGKQRIPELITDFIAHNEKWLDPPRNVNPGTITTSRRSWDRYGEALRAAGVEEDPENDDFQYIGLGYVGAEAAIAFQQFAKNSDSRITGADIINNFSKVKSKIDKLGSERQNVAIEKVAEYILTKLETPTLTDKQGKNLSNFMEILPHELRLACWSKLMDKGINNIELCKSIHKYVKKHVLDVFGVPEGEAGMGIMPNLPNFLNKDATAKK